MPAKIQINDYSVCRIVDDFVLNEKTISQISEDLGYKLDIVRNVLLDVLPADLYREKILGNSRVVKQELSAWNKGITGEASSSYGRVFSPETRLKISQANKGKSRPQSKETREKISRTLASKIAGNQPREEKVKWKQGYFDSLKTGKIWFYRSSFELEVLNYLESCENVISFVVEPFSIPWINAEGGLRHYTPDLEVILSSKKMICEIKPFYKTVIDEVVKTKISAAKDWCDQNGYEFVVITEKELKASLLGSIFEEQ